MLFPCLAYIITALTFVWADDDWTIVYPHTGLDYSGNTTERVGEIYDLACGTPPSMVSELLQADVYLNTTLISTELVLNSTAIQKYAQSLAGDSMHKRSVDNVSTGPDADYYYQFLTQMLMKEFSNNTTAVTKRTWCSSLYSYIKDSTTMQVALASVKKFKAKFLDTFIGEGISTMYSLGLDMLSMAVNIASLTKTASTAKACNSVVKAFKYTSGTATYNYVVGIYPYTTGSKCDTTLTEEEIAVIVADRIDEGERLKSVGWCTTLTHGGTWHARVKVLRMEVSTACLLSFSDIICESI
ncbi:hypothetical protein KAFR_0A08240 [Kazachstania africana CBS 2517]|uniref:Secreted protein CSS2 C-terminal domain-containing protein n=1 Tax=Kazachstania africana (strain ATCC 22294 / BCRC 22015 / CBS 2517 / CECT 1963 / NBRC 1671 / NRRL Y-8276) TaxID=1071382 RepID=H2APF8_KAZAF|nr:hypothetical protein KAFR_0A08240 [Kazachstania africana CBS 2517]CCF56258.1 hypothetical protein KAFR_0A08240 [Kazachstania africana CBS 2517]